MRKLLLLIVNVIALAFMLSNNIQQVIIGVTIIISCYLFLLFSYVYTPINNKNYALKATLGIGVIAKPVKRAYNKVEKIVSYDVEERILTDEKWNNLKNVLNSFALEFLHKNFPSVAWDSQFYLMKYSEETAGTAGMFINSGLYRNLLSPEKPIGPIILNEAFVYAVIKFNDFKIIEPIVEHELIHYALWKQGRGFHDHEEDFEETLSILNVPSNNPENTTGYSFGITRVDTGKGIEDTLYLVIPPNEQSKKDNYMSVLRLYKNRYK